MHSKATVGNERTPGHTEPRIIRLSELPAGFLRQPPAGLGRSRAGAKSRAPASAEARSHRSHRLPRYDAGTRRFEFGVFVGLGLAALALIGPALLESGRFAQNREAIVDALATGQPAPTQLAACPTNRSGTNLTVVPGRGRDGRTS